MKMETASKINNISIGFVLVVLVSMIFIPQLQQFWYIGLILVGIWFVVDVLNDRVQRKRYLEVRKIAQRVHESLEEMAKETELVTTGKIPTDDDILLYYKMYLKKKELEDRSEWTTEETMSFEKWEEKVKNASTIDGQHLGYQFMVGKTSDIFIGFPPNMTSHRLVNYKRLVEEDEA